MMDSSGRNAAEIVALQKEIDEAEQDYQDSLVNQALDRLQDANEKAAQQRERQIELAQKQLDSYADSSKIWEDVTTLYNNTQAQLSAGIKINETDLSKLITDVGDNLNPLAKEDFWNDLSSSFAKAFGFDLLNNDEGTSEEGMGTTLSGKLGSLDDKIGVVSDKFNDTNFTFGNPEVGEWVGKDNPWPTLPEYGGPTSDAFGTATDEIIKAIKGAASEDKPNWSPTGLPNKGGFVQISGGSGKGEGSGGSSGYVSNSEKITGLWGRDWNVDALRAGEAAAGYVKTDDGSSWYATDGTIDKDATEWARRQGHTEGYTFLYDGQEYIVSQDGQNSKEIVARKITKQEDPLASESIEVYEDVQWDSGWDKESFSKAWNTGAIKIGRHSYDYYSMLNSDSEKASNIASFYNLTEGQVFSWNGSDWLYAWGQARIIGTTGTNPLKYASKTPYKFETGGLADFTGPAWLDGTPSRPEYILNADQTARFFELIDILGDINKFDATGGKSNGDNYFDIQINVENIEDDYDVEQLAEKIKSMIYDDATYRNVNTIRRLH